MGMETVAVCDNQGKSAVVGTKVVVVPWELGCGVREYRGYWDSGHGSKLTAGKGAIS